MAFKFYTTVEKILKLKARMFQGIILTFAKVTEKNLLGEPFCAPLVPSIRNRFKNKAIFVLMEGFHLPQNKSHYRSSHRRCSERSVLSNFQKFTGKHLCQSLFFNKVVGFSLWKEKLWPRCFHVNFVNFLGAYFLQNKTPLGDCFCHYEKTEPFTAKYLSHSALPAWRKFYSGSNLGISCSMLFMFSR